MKTLIKRPNYTLSIKTSCYSAFSFYPFFRNDRIPALPSARTNSFTTEAFLFCFTSTACTSALYIGEGRTKASSTKPLTKSEFTKAWQSSANLTSLLYIGRTEALAIYMIGLSSITIYRRGWSIHTKNIFFLIARPERQNYFGLYFLPYIYAAGGSYVSLSFTRFSHCGMI